MSNIAGQLQLVFIGELSYGLYLFHFPVYFWLDAPTVGVSGYRLLAVRVLVSACIAMASFWWLEQPIRHGKFSGHRLACIGAMVAAGVAAATSIGIWTPAPKPKSDLLAYVLTNAARTAPPNAIRVLVVGGSAAAFLGEATTKPFDADGIYGVSIGSYGCGLTGESTSCRETPDDLAALAGAYRADAVVLMPDAADLGGFSSGMDVAHRAERLLVRFDQLKAEVGKRRIVVLEVPCNAWPARSRAEFNRIIRSWANRRDVPIGDSGFAECHGVKPVIAGVSNIWATIGRLVSGRS